MQQHERRTPAGTPLSCLGGLKSFVDDPCCDRWRQPGRIVNPADRRGGIARAQLDLLSSLRPDRIVSEPARQKVPRGRRRMRCCSPGDAAHRRPAPKRVVAHQLHEIWPRRRTGVRRFFRAAAYAGRGRADCPRAGDGGRSVTAPRAGSAVGRSRLRRRRTGTVPMPLKVLDETIKVRESAVQRRSWVAIELGALRRLDDQARALERHATGPALDDLIADERQRSHSYGGRPCSDGGCRPRPAAGGRDGAGSRQAAIASTSPAPTLCVKHAARTTRSPRPGSAGPAPPR